VDHYLTDAEVDGLHQRGDCWLSLPHGEGWDLGAFDAAVFGTPVVTTDWGAPRTYLDREASWLVPSDVVPAPVGATGEVPSSWAAPDLDRAVDLLREVRHDPPAARRRAAPQAVSLAERYAPRVVAEQFVQAIEALVRRS
jgi:glycosyltransferase involved in cell wall biosynthesis